MQEVTKEIEIVMRTKTIIAIAWEMQGDDEV
jgi:hypothetical protein